MAETNKSGLAAFWSDNYFPALDGLRAVSIFLVFFVHIATLDKPPIRGWIGVSIFFVLSGFLITTLLLREREHFGRISMAGFYVRRFFRIIPIYYLVLFSYIPVVLLMHDAVRWREFKLAMPYLVSFMPEFRPPESGFVFGQAWSLGFEEKFYLVWPLLTMVLFPLKRLYTVMALAAVAFGLFFVPPTQSTNSYGALFLGSLLALMLAKSTPTAFSWSLARIPVSVALLPVLATYAGLFYYPDQILPFSASIAVLIGTLVLRPSWLRSVLERPWMVYCGKRSYAMYLIHVLIIHGVEVIFTRFHALHWYTVIPVAYALSVAGATVLFYLVERPCLTYGRRLSKRLREKHSAAPLPSSAISSFAATTAMDAGVAPIEREEAGVPNAFADEDSQRSAGN